MVSGRQPCHHIRLFVQLEEVPRVFELVTNGGRDVISPPKGSHNFWLTLILFVAHADVYNDGRLGHLSIDATGLNLIDVISA